MRIAVVYWCSLRWLPSSTIKSKGWPPVSAYTRSRSAVEFWFPTWILVPAPLDLVDHRVEQTLSYSITCKSSLSGGTNSSFHTATLPPGPFRASQPRPTSRMRMVRSVSVLPKHLRLAIGSSTRKYISWSRRCRALSVCCPIMMASSFLWSPLRIHARVSELAH